MRLQRKLKVGGLKLQNHSSLYIYTQLLHTIFIKYILCILIVMLNILYIGGRKARKRTRLEHPAVPQESYKHRHINPMLMSSDVAPALPCAAASLYLTKRKRKASNTTVAEQELQATYSLTASALSAFTPWPYRKQYARLFCACALPCSAASVYLPTRRQASRRLPDRHARAPAQLKRGRPVFLDASAVVVQVAEVYLTYGIAVLGSGSK